MVDTKGKLNDESPDFQWKLILVGNKRVGKTSISNRYCTDTFNEDQQSSQHLQFQKKNLDIAGTNKWAQLHIWDTLGQEKFKSMAPIFFRRSVGAFLVYDVTNMESFLALQSWHEQINNNADGKIVVMLLGNKCDLPNKVVTSQMGQEFAKSHGMGFMEVSAKSDIGVKAAFTSLASAIY